jgi:hypothetical protein
MDSAICILKERALSAGGPVQIASGPSAPTAGATLQTVDIEDRLFLAIIYLFLDGFSKFKVPHIALNPYYMPIENKRE